MLRLRQFLHWICWQIHQCFGMRPNPTECNESFHHHHLEKCHLSVKRKMKVIMALNLRLKRKCNILTFNPCTFSIISASHDYISPKCVQLSGDFKSNASVSAGNYNRFTIHSVIWVATVGAKCSSLINYWYCVCNSMRIHSHRLSSAIIWCNCIKIRSLLKLIAIDILCYFLATNVLHISKKIIDSKKWKLIKLNKLKKMGHCWCHKQNIQFDVKEQLMQCCQQWTLSWNI